MNDHRHIYDHTGHCFECDSPEPAASFCKRITGQELQFVAGYIGKDPKTLRNWRKHSPLLFRAVMHGVKAQLDDGEY